MSNFVPNRIVTIKPSEPEWFTSGIKAMLKKQNRLDKKYKTNGFREIDKVSLDIHREKCAESIERSKQNYFLNLERKLANNRTGQKSNWKIVNNLLNKCKIPHIPPLLISDKFVTSCKEKATLFNNFFVAQCQPITNASVLPNVHLLTTAKLDTLEISNAQILNILNNLMANKAHGPDEISVNVIKLSGNTLCELLKLIFRNIFETGIFPKLEKGKHYRPISLLPIFAKVFEKIIFVNLYNYLVTNNLITKNQSGFKPGDSVTNQLIFLVHQIYSSFDHPENLDVRYVYLDMSKAFDKVWHEGLIFKTKWSYG